MMAPEIGSLRRDALAQMETLRKFRRRKNSKLGRTRRTAGSFAKSLASDNARNRNEGEPGLRAGL